MEDLKHVTPIGWFFVALMFSVAVWGLVNYKHWIHGI